MQSRILLIRHGRSAHVHREGWVDAAGVRRWREAYDAAGIADDEAPPADLVGQVAHADLVLASDLPRATRSAERLAPGREVCISRLLREAALDVPTWAPLRWPLGVWAVLIHLQWGYRMLGRADATRDELDRADAAATWLGQCARNGSTVVVVTHGAFRRLVAQRLVAAGWQSGPERRSYRPWSAWRFHSVDQDHGRAGGVPGERP